MISQKMQDALNAHVTAELYSAARAHQFSYPETLDAWLAPEWKLHDLRKNPVTPWLRKKDIDRIRDFERVLNAVYPTVSDLKLRGFHRALLKLLGAWRYRMSVYGMSYEIAVAQRMVRYRQPEIEGF